jgi:hypothetical protein
MRWLDELDGACLHAVHRCSAGSGACPVRLEILDAQSGVETSNDGVIMRLKASDGGGLVGGLTLAALVGE